jgi:hypothetical protein
MSHNSYTTTVGFGKGLRHGVVSELSAFLTIKPGEADDLRAALVRLHERLRKAPWDYIRQIGVHDMRHVIYENDTRLLWATEFDTDWDPYIDDALALIGVDSFGDWLQHTVGWDDIDHSSSQAIKRYVQSAQVPATCYYQAIPDMALGQIRKAQRITAAFEKVLDTPGAAEALQNPVFTPLLDEAAG